MGSGRFATAAPVRALASQGVGRRRSAAVACQHCYAKVFNARTDADAVEHWIPVGRDPQAFAVEDLQCVPGDARLVHAPMPQMGRAGR